MQLTLTSMVRALVVAVLGTALAVVIAILASPLMPIGPARVAEPDPGISIDGAVLLAGGALVFVSVLVIALVPAWWYSRPASFAVVDEAPIRPSRIARWVRAGGASLPAAAGVRMALEPGRGSTAVPARTTIVGATIALTTVIGAFTFAASLDHLVSTPRLFGWGWDALLDVSVDTDVQVQARDAIVADVRDSDAVAGFADTAISRLLVDGVAVTTLAIGESHGGVGPTVVSGRAPRTDREIALGAKTLERLGAEVGDTVTVQAAGGADARLRVVGRVVLPGLGNYPGSDKTALGEGAVTTLDAVEELGPDFGAGPVLVRFAESADRSAFTRGLQEREAAAYSVNLSGLQRPSDIVSYERVSSTPFLLAAVLAALAVAIVSHGLVTVVRRRRREFALLKTLGFTRRQVSSSVAWQATTIGVAALGIRHPARRRPRQVGVDDAGRRPRDGGGATGARRAARAGDPRRAPGAQPGRVPPGPDGGAAAPGCRPEERVSGGSAVRAVGMLSRVTLRQRWRHVVVLTLFVGVAGAVVLALVAGARRTDSALARFERDTATASVEITVGEANDAELDELRRAPGVAAVGVLHQFTVVTADGDGFPTVGQVDGSFGTVVDRARLIEGSEPDQSKVDEVAIGEALAEELGLRVGDELEIIGYSSEDVDAPAGVAEPHGPRVPLRIVGIVRRPLDLGGRGAVGGVVVLTRAFTDEYRDRIGSYVGTVLRVRAERGADGVAGIGQVARRIFGDNERFSLTGLAIEGAVAQNAVDVTTVGLLIAAGVAALTSIVGIGIALARVIALADVEQPTLAALGARRRTRALAAGAVALPIAVVGACLAVVGAVLASPVFPIGVAADAEPDPGVDLDGVTLLVGFVLVAAVVLAIAAVTARRTARVGTDVRERVRPGYAVRVASDAGFPPPVAAGIRFALDRSRVRPSLPVRSSLLGAAMGVVVIVAAMVYIAGLDHLVSTPAAYGWTWDTAVGDAEAVAAGDDCGVVNTRLTGVDGLGAITAICNGALEVDGRPVIGWAYRRVSGEPIGPAMVEGRPPATSTEVVLGRDTLVEIGKEIGDRVRIAGSERGRRFRIVGTSAFPVVSDTQALAEGAVLTAAGMRSTGRVSDGWNLVARYAVRCRPRRGARRGPEARGGHRGR